jgi:hypothetical protein
MLTSDAFYSAENRGVLVKSPIDLVVGTMHQFDMRPGAPVPFAFAAAGMGQNLFSPPNVKGWPGGEAWINASTLLARKQFLDRLFRADDAGTRMQTDALPPAIAALPKAVTAPNGAQDDEKARQLRFMRAMERGLASVQFDSAAWFARLDGTDDALSRSARASRLLLAIAPQTAHEPSEVPLTVVRQLVLDPVYQLK